jgi:casein kinase II subunit beta
MSAWVSNFLSHPEGSFFVSIDTGFISSTSQTPEIRSYFSPSVLTGAVATILGTEKSSKYDAQARHLYGLLHRRFLSTSDGMLQMVDRFRSHSFPGCPRALCHGFTCLPCALTDDDNDKAAVYLFCPNCTDFYAYQAPADLFIPAIYFGKKWIHHLMNEHPEIVPTEKPEAFEPLLFGYRVYAPKAKPTGTE